MEYLYVVGPGGSISGEIKRCPTSLEQVDNQCEVLQNVPTNTHILNDVLFDATTSKYYGIDLDFGGNVRACDFDFEAGTSHCPPITDFSDTGQPKLSSMALNDATLYVSYSDPNTKEGIFVCNVNKTTEGNITCSNKENFDGVSRKPTHLLYDSEHNLLFISSEASEKPTEAGLLKCTLKADKTIDICTVVTGNNVPSQPGSLAIAVK